MKKNAWGYVFLLNTVILFSTFEVVSKTIVGKVDSFQINFIRFLVGGLVLFLFALLKGEFKISKKDLLKVTAIGIVNVVISMNLLQLSLYVDGAKASVVAVIFSSNPIFVTMFSAILDREKIPIYKIMGLLLGVIGIVVVFFDNLKFSLSDYKSPLFALIAAIFFGLFTVLGKKVSMNIGSLRMNSYSFILGSLILLPFLLIYKVPVIKFDYSALWQIAYIAIFVTGIAYLTYFKGLAVVGASSGSMVFFMKPVLASVLAVIFLNEKATLNLLIGTLLIIAGIAVVLYWTRLYEKFVITLKEFKLK